DMLTSCGGAFIGVPGIRPSAILGYASGETKLGGRKQLSCTIYQAALGKETDVATRRSSQRSTFSADTWSDQRTGSDTSRDRSTDHRPPRPRIRAPYAGDSRRPEAGVPDARPDRDLSRVRHRRVGGRAGQYAVSGRSRAH